jgi:phytoene synthase
MKNSYEKYCYEKVASLNSALYYSLRKLSLKQRNQVVAIHAFYREIEDIILECENHELALIKFNWWRGEVAKLTEKKSDHPVLILLQDNSNDLEKIQDRLFNIIDGFEQNAISSTFKTFEEVVVHWMRTAGERELVLNEIIVREEIISEEILYQLMLVIEIVYYVQHLRFYLRHDLIYFSLDELQQFIVTQAMLKEYVTTPQIKKLLEFQVEKVDRAYARIKELSSKQRKALSHFIIRCEIARATLREIQRSDFRVLENLIVLTPLRYAWIAFRG